MTQRILHEHTTAGQSALSPDFFTNLPAVFEQNGICIYQGRNEVRALEIKGQKIVIKKYGIPPIFNRILYSWGIRTPKAVRSFRNAQKILERGFHTPLPYIQEVYYEKGLLGKSYFVSSWASGKAVGSVHKTGKLIRALARYTARLHEQGMMHRDYLLNNIHFTEKDGKYKFELIDINRFIFKNKPLGWFAVCVNLMQPFYRDKQLKIFVTEYARVRHINENILVWCVLRFRHIRNGYSQLKKILRKLPGAYHFSRKAKHPARKAR